jgi:hypothetical protein
MKKVIGVLAVLGLLGAVAWSARANEAAPPPDPVRPENTPAAAPFVIVVDDGAQQPRLEIPRKVLSSLRAAGDTQDGDTRRAGILPQLHTIIAGVALSLAVTLGGLWLVRSRRRGTGPHPALLITALALATVGGVLWANVPAPPPPRDVPAGISVTDKMTVQVANEGDAIRLIVSSKQLAGAMDKVRANRDKQAQPGEQPADKKPGGEN